MVGRFFIDKVYDNNQFHLIQKNSALIQVKKTNFINLNKHYVKFT